MSSSLKSNSAKGNDAVDYSSSPSHSKVTSLIYSPSVRVGTNPPPSLLLVRLHFSGGLVVDRHDCLTLPAGSTGLFVDCYCRHSSQEEVVLPQQ